jgi:hypothetical protein
VLSRPFPQPGGFEGSRAATDPRSERERSQDGRRRASWHPPPRRSS